MKKELIKSFERACEVTGDNATKLPDVSWMPENRGKAMIATYKMEIIEKAQNMLDKFVPDYSKNNQRKWYPWHEWVASRSAFVYTFAHCTITGTGLGSRFCFIDSETAEFMGTQHADLYNDMMRKS
jgi:hypothetical protein